MSSTVRTLIVGAGGFGREIYWWMQSHSDPRWAASFAGFLDDDDQALQEFTSYAPGVVGSISGYVSRPDEQLVMAVADPAVKRKLADDLRMRGARFATFVHSSATVVPNAIIGPGCVLCPGSIVSCDTGIGEFVTMNVYACVGHDGRVGDWSTLSPHAQVMGNAKLGQGVFLGTHASILPGVSVGDFARIGANSLVIRQVRAGQTMIGVPATRLEFPSVTSTSPQRKSA